MKKVTMIFMLLSIVLLSAVNAKDTYVNGYVRKDGAYVQPHYRTAPNSNSYDNYSTKGNINPYTGKEGTVEPYQKYNNSNTYETPSYGTNKKSW